MRHDAHNSTARASIAPTPPQTLISPHPVSFSPAGRQVRGGQHAGTKGAGRWPALAAAPRRERTPAMHAGKGTREGLAAGGRALARRQPLCVSATRRLNTQRSRKAQHACIERHAWLKTAVHLLVQCAGLAPTAELAAAAPPHWVPTPQANGTQAMPTALTSVALTITTALTA